MDFSDLGGTQVSGDGIDFSDLGGKKVEDQTPKKSVGEFVGNVFDNTLRAINPLNIAKGLGEQVKTGLYDVPKQAATSMVQLPGYLANKIMGDKTAQRPMFPLEKEITQSPIVKDPVNWAYKNPVDAGMLVATPFLMGRGAFTPKSAAAGAALESEAPSAATSSAATDSKALAPLAEQQTPQPLNVLQRFGTRGVNSHAGISPETVQAMTRAGQNPADIGAMVGKRLVDENVIGQSPAETFTNASLKKNQYGDAVSKALDDIKAANRSSGEYDNVEDPLHVDATRALKPLLDKKVGLANSPFSASRRMARPWTEAYDYLAGEANKGNGMLTLDHVQGAMQQIGQTLGQLEKGTAPYKNAASLYGTLANMRDSMVNDIASRVGNPKLASNLLNANQGYSFYSRIMPDINWQAAADSVGGPEMSITGNIKTEAAPTLFRTAVNTGEAVKKSPPLSKTVPLGLMFRKSNDQQP